MVTILLPAYNERDIVARTVSEWHTEVTSRLPGARILVVDDCSTDGTAEVLEDLRRQLPCLDVVRPDRNGGHGAALRFGFRHVHTQYVFHTDSDGQHVASEFWDLWRVRDDFDFVFGERRTRADGILRSANSTAMRILVWILWDEWIRDSNCPFKLMRRTPLQTVLDQIPQDTFAPMVAVSVLSRTMGFRTTTVPVSHLERRGGTPSLKGASRLLRVSLTCARQFVALRASAPQAATKPEPRTRAASGR